MLQILLLILIGFAGIWIGSFLARKRDIKDAGSLESANQAREENKERNKGRILELLRGHDRVSNDDIEKLLNISDSTATNYLKELEDEGKIIQQGEAGRGVYYILKKDQING